MKGTKKFPDLCEQKNVLSAAVHAAVQAEVERIGPDKHVYFKSPWDLTESSENEEELATSLVTYQSGSSVVGFVYSNLGSTITSMLGIENALSLLATLEDDDYQDEPLEEILEEDEN